MAFRRACGKGGNVPGKRCAAELMLFGGHRIFPAFKIKALEVEGQPQVKLKIPHDLIGIEVFFFAHVFRSVFHDRVQIAGKLTDQNELNVIL